MPTKAKKVGFFEKLGARLDSGVAWVCAKIKWACNTYHTLNTDYVKSIRQKKFLRILPCSLMLLALFCVIVPIFAAKIIDNDVSLLVDNSFSTSIASMTISPTEPLLKGEFSQSIDNGDWWGEISNIDIIFGTYDRSNHANYEFVLREDGVDIYTQDFSATILQDNKYHRFKFDAPITLKEGHNYSFAIVAKEAAENDAIAAYRNSEGEIVYRMGRRSEFYGPVIISSIVFFIMFCLINFLINSGKIKNEFYFLASALIYIIPIAFIYPVYTVPDEPYHFLSVLRVRDYDLSKSPHDNLSQMEHTLPTNSECLSIYFGNAKTPGKVTADDIASCFESKPSSLGAYVNAPVTVKIPAYTISTLGVMFGDLVSDSPMIIFYFGRVFNLAAISIILIFALNLIKKHRMILLAAIFIPVFLQQAVSYSYDGLLNSLCILMIAYSIRFLTMDVKVRKMDIVIMAIALVLIGIIKLPYILIATPLLVVKSERFGKHKMTKWFIGVGLLAIIFATYIICSSYEALGTIPSEAVDNGRGFPLATLFQPSFSGKIFLRTLYHNSIFYITSSIGAFGWFFFELDSLIIVAYLIFIIAVVLSDSEVKFSRAMRIWSILAAIILIGSFFLVMYLQWTPRESLVIEGVQGRYFLPVIPLLMIALMPRKKKFELPADTCYALFNLTTLSYVITLLIGFY